MPVYSADEPSLDRFFTSPRLRAELNRARDDYSGAQPGSPVSGEASLDEYISPDVRLDGVVIRGDGSADIWINRGSVSQQRQVQLRSNQGGRESISVRLPGGKRIRLKPGQYYSPEHQAVKEAYEKRPAEPALDTLEDNEQASTESKKSLPAQHNKQ